MEEIQEDWLLDRLSEDPTLSLQSLEYDSSSDEDWMTSVQQRVEQENLKKIFEKIREEDFEEVERETR